MSDTTYSVQIAKSNRAKCKTCKMTIDKGELKLMVEIPQREGQAFAVSNSHHISCFKLPRKLGGGGANRLSLEDFVDDYLQDGSDDGSILSERKEEILAALHQAASAAKTPSKASNDEDGGDDDDDNIVTRLKAAAKDAETENTKNGPAKKKMRMVHGDDDFDKMLPLYQKYQKAKLGDLKDILKWNKQIMAGVKDFVLFKVMDGALHGRLGVCPLCQGDLKFVEGDYDTVHCRGRYDEDIGMAIPCNYRAPRLDKKVPRLHPFYLVEPTEDEKEAMTKAREDARGEGDAASHDNPIAQDLLEKAASLKIDLSTNVGKKDAAAAFVGLVQGKVDLPDNRNATMEIGRLIMSNQDKSPKQIMEVIIAKYGFADVKVEKAAAKEAAAEAACANPKNAPLILAFRECAKYYFQEGNRNAGTSYIRTVDTLTNLKEEVTESNAMSFSKGKTKLPNIGKGSAEKMLEFVTTGTFAKLEEKRALYA